MRLYAIPFALVLALSFLSCSGDTNTPLRTEPATEMKQPDYRVGALCFYDLRATGGIRNGSAAAYAVIANVSSRHDTLTGASSSACSTTEIHEMANFDGVRVMRATGALPVLPSEHLVLKPGGTHIMLMGLENTLRKGDSIDVTLNFAKTGAVVLRIPVR